MTTSGMQRGVRVRLAEDSDDLDAVNAGNAQWLGADAQRRLAAAMPPGTRCDILVGELAGEPVGCAVALTAAKEAFGYGEARVYVQPAARRQGVGGALFDWAVAALRAAELPGVMVAVPDDEPDGAAAVTARGLVEHGHHVESALDLTTLDDAVVDAAVARAEAAGCTLSALPPDAAEDEWLAGHEFLADRAEETPDSRDGGARLPYPVFRAMIIDPWQVVIARRAGEIVGGTALMHRNDAPLRLNTFLTGVHPSARGNGLAAALKTHHARLVRDAGWREILTQNMDQNAPILAVNRQLGFRPVGGRRDFGLAF